MLYFFLVRINVCISFFALDQCNIVSHHPNHGNIYQNIRRTPFIKKKNLEFFFFFYLYHASNKLNGQQRSQESNHYRRSSAESSVNGRNWEGGMVLASWNKPSGPTGRISVFGHLQIVMVISISGIILCKYTHGTK